MFNFNQLLLLTLLINPLLTFGKLSDFRLCANKECTEPVALAKTLLSYNSAEDGILSFQANADVKIFSKSAGSRIDIWGVEINGKRGYAPLTFLRETRVLKGKLDFLVPTEVIEQTKQTEDNLVIKEAPNQDPNKNEFSPDGVTPPYEILDGTTIYMPTVPPIAPETQSDANKNGAEATTPLPTLTNKNVPQNVEPSQSPKEDPKNVEANKEQQNEVPAPKTANENVETGENKQKVETNSEEIDESEDDNEEEGDDEEDEAEGDEEDEDAVVDNEDSKNPDNPKMLSEEHIGDYNEMNLKVEKNESKPEVKSVKPETPPIEEKIPVLPTPLPSINQIDLTKMELNNVPNMEEPNLQYLKTPEPQQTPENPNINPDPPKNVDKPADLPVIQVEKQEPLKVESQILEETKSIPQNNDGTRQEKVETLQSIEKEQKIEETSSNPDAVKEVELPKEQNSTADHLKVDPISIDVQKEEQIFLEVTKVEEQKPIELDISENTVVDGPKVEGVAIPEQKNDEVVSQNVSQVPESDQKVPSTKEEVELPNKVPENIEILPNISSEHNIPEPMFGFVTTESPQSFEIPPPIVEEVTEKVMVETESPIDQPLTSETPIKQEEVVPEKTEETTEGPGILTGMFSWMSSSEPEVETTTQSVQIVDEKKLLEDALLLDKITENKMAANDNKMDDLNKMEDEIEKIREVIDQKLDFTTAKSIEFGNEDSQLYDKHQHEKPFEKYVNNENYHKQTDSNEDGCSQSENPSECLEKLSIDDTIREKMSDINENNEKPEEDEWSIFDINESGVNILLYLTLTAITLLLFSLGHYYIEKRRIDNRLVSNINELEKKLLVVSKESQLLQEELSVTKEKLSSVQDSSSGSNEIVLTLKEELEEARITRTELEDQIATLEKELENATEAGLELNKMLADFLASQSGNDNIMENVEHLQKQLFEQQSTINTINGTLNMRNLENEKLQAESMKASEKIEQLQSELDQMVVNLLSVQEAKSKNEAEFEEQSKQLKEELESKIQVLTSQLDEIKQENLLLKQKCDELKRNLDLKNNEYQVLKDSMKEVSTNKDSLAALLDVSKVKAEVQQLREDKHALTLKLGTENESKQVAEKQIQVIMQELKILKDKLEEADKEKVEAQTRLDVLSTYFKEKEAQLQKEIAEHETMWLQKQGEATSTVERIKWIQEELQNYKSQTEILKKEILDQEVSMKSQISMLEKKSHDNWVLARQAERKLEESKQEASQLRNRLTIVEKNLSNASLDESKLQSRVMQPIEANGDIAVSPLHMGSVDNPGSPPLLYPHRDHMTTSPPLPGLPFMPPPPPGVPFMPPPPGVPPFMPPPLFPGDHRPPPLGRMSSPPMHGRYSPDSRAYSPYDRDDSPPPSPGYPDSDYRRGRSPPRNYSPYRDYRDRPPPQRNMKNRNHKVSSSGSGNSNESLDNSGRHSRV